MCRYDSETAYLIVGANGFVGSYMIKNILEKTNRKILAVDCNILGKEDTNRLEWIKCDVTNQNDIEKVNSKCNEYKNVKVLYLAAYHSPDLVKRFPKKAWDINITGLSLFLKTKDSATNLFFP